MRIVHILSGSSGRINPQIVKFFLDYVALIDGRIGEQVFYLFQKYELISERGKQDYGSLIDNNASIHFVNPTKFNILRTFLKFRRDDIVVLHSGRLTRLWFILMLLPWLWDRIAMICWGCDIGNFIGYSESRAFSGRFLHQIQSCIVPKLRAVCTLTPGEFPRIRSIFRNCDNYLNVFYSTISPEEGIAEYPEDKKKTDVTRVVVNHAASPHGNHEEVYGWLSEYKDEQLQVLSILSSGPSTEASRIAQLGSDIFKDKYSTLSEILPYVEYVKFFDEYDILVMNYKVQAGLGITKIFLSKGKPVYLRSESPVFEMLKGMGIEVRDTNSIPSLSYDDFTRPLSRETIENNARILSQKLSLESSLMSWKRLFVRMAK
ncbi:MAG: TDP-N-acetylfucosamine:lipid II N-acetylfucosaminyltransferase [Acidobacteria bacterium]|nr:TDP-N-acetylfucosamine:lipid II N-acetylfucosaminyltransferase [Acidobacteriota bacterium]